MRDIGFSVPLTLALDRANLHAKANWLEQAVNGIAQACFFVRRLLI